MNFNKSKLILLIVYYYAKENKRKMLIEKFITGEELKNTTKLPKKVIL